MPRAKVDPDNAELSGTESMGSRRRSRHQEGDRNKTERRERNMANKTGRTGKATQEEPPAQETTLTETPQPQKTQGVPNSFWNAVNTGLEIRTQKPDKDEPAKFAEFLPAMRVLDGPSQRNVTVQIGTIVLKAAIDKDTAGPQPAACYAAAFIAGNVGVAHMVATYVKAARAGLELMDFLTTEVLTWSTNDRPRFDFRIPALERAIQVIEGAPGYNGTVLELEGEKRSTYAESKRLFNGHLAKQKERQTKKAFQVGQQKAVDSVDEGAKAGTTAEA